MQESANPFARLLRKTLVPLFLILVCPPAVFAFWYTCTQLDGSFLRLFQFFAEVGVFKALYKIAAPHFFGSLIAWKIIAFYATFQLMLMRILPGKTVHGPITPAGNIPAYTANGILAFFITLATYYLGAYPLHLFSPTIIYDNFGDILGALNIFSLAFCLFLLGKGLVAPSSSDHGSSGNLIFDYYWGTELYPRIYGWDVKMFTNCRFGMMAWPLIILSFAAKQNELYGLSNSMVLAVSLQLLYVFKFFVWEPGYLRSLDIMHDRAGYYICWGCLVWVPGIYTSPTLYLVNHPHTLGLLPVIAILTLGSLSILINYLADRQRQRVRALNGNCTIWGKQPVITVARYTTEQGEAKYNLLLACGWWGIARHFHYVPEVLGAFCWSVPALFDNFLPYFYVIFLATLLTERAFRDDRRCALKYGEDWETYCDQVPYKIIPYVI